MNLYIFISVATEQVMSAMIFSLEFEMSHMRSIAKYRSSNKIIIYFIVANDNGQRKINLSILLVLPLAKTYNELMHRDGLIYFL